MAPRRRRAELPALLHDHDAGRGPGRGAVGVRRVAPRDRPLVRRGSRRRAARRPPGRPARPGRVPRGPGPPHRRRLRAGREDPRARRAPADLVGDRGHDRLRRARAHRPGAGRPGGQAPLDALEARLRGVPVDWASLTHDTKRAVADGALLAEVRRIARELLRWSSEGAPAPVDETQRELEDAVAEVLACFPVYRSYLPLGREHLDAGAGRRARASARPGRPPSTSSRRCCPTRPTRRRCGSSRRAGW